MEKLISVVIPVYNVQAYLKQCLDSVVNQTYSNLQIILVDDGSTDSSGRICDEYAERDKRITVVHQQNSGAGAAKNTGLELVKGDYLSMIDSDDFIDLNMYKIMAGEMEAHEADIVQCTHCNAYVSASKKILYKENQPDRELLGTTDFLKEYLYFWQYAVFWNKLFKSSLIEKARFPEGRKIDDEFFTYKLVCNAKKVLSISTPLYNYRMRKSSVMNENSKLELVSDRVDCFVERYDYVTERYPHLTGIYYDKLSDLLLYYKNTYGPCDFIESAIKRFPVKRSFLVTSVKERLRSNKYRPAPKGENTEKEYYN